MDKIALCEIFQNYYFGSVCTVLYLTKTVFLTGIVKIFFLYSLVKVYFTGTSLTKKRVKYSIVAFSENLF